MLLRPLLQFLVSFTLFLSCAVWLHQHVEFDEHWPNIAGLMARHVTTDDVRQQINQAIDADKPDDARMYLTLAQRFGYDINAQTYDEQIAVMESPWNTTVRETKAFSSGFVSGQASTGAGLAGVMVSDVTVVGDVRDLWTEYQHHRNNEPVDDLVVALSGIGVAATAATVGSLGVAASARAGVSLLKLAAKGRHLSAPFRAYLVSRAGKVFNVSGFFQKAKVHPTNVIEEAKAAYNPVAASQLEKVASQINGIRKETSTATTLALLRYVDNTKDLRGVERVARKYGPESRGIMRFLGKSAIKVTRVLRKTTQWMAAVISVAFAALSVLLSALSIAWQFLKLSWNLFSRFLRGINPVLGLICMGLLKKVRRSLRFRHTRLIRLKS